MTNKATTSKWKDKQYRRAYNREWNDAKTSGRSVNHDNVAQYLEEIRRAEGTPKKELAKTKPSKNHRFPKAVQIAQPKEREAEPVALTQCPCCKSKFFMLRGSM